MTDTAIDYVADEMALVGMPISMKGPITPGWNKAENVITDAIAAATLTENVGLAHAFCKPAPTMALDIDDLSKARAFLSD